MRTSETLVELTKALVAAQGEFPVIPKDKTAKVETRTGSGYSYTYADLEACVTKTQPILAKHGLAVIQPIESVENGDILTSRLMHVSGEWVESEKTLPYSDTTPPQQQAGVITYMRRYTYCALLRIVSDEDKDGAHSEPAPRKRQQAPVPISDRPSSHAAPASHETAVADGETGEVKPAYSAEDIARLKREAMAAQGGDRPRITALPEPEPARVTNLQEKAAQLQQRTRPAPA